MTKILDFIFCLHSGLLKACENFLIFSFIINVYFFKVNVT